MGRGGQESGCFFMARGIKAVVKSNGGMAMGWVRLRNKFLVKSQAIENSPLVQDLLIEVYYKIIICTFEVLFVSTA